MVLVTGIPQLREAGWLITGPDKDPVRHLFTRLEEHMDDSGIWTVELRECRGRGGKAAHSYPTESEARDSLDMIYRLSRHLAPLPTWDQGQVEPARWRIRVYDPTEQDLHQRDRRRQRAASG